MIYSTVYKVYMYKNESQTFDRAKLLTFREGDNNLLHFYKLSKKL